MEALEDKFTQHLEESGGIRADLAWLKKAVILIVPGAISMFIALTIYVLNRLH